MDGENSIQETLTVINGLANRPGVSYILFCLVFVKAIDFLIIIGYRCFSCRFEFVFLFFAKTKSSFVGG